MNENEKDFMEQLNNLDDSSVEEIAENYPALDDNAKKRILKKSLRKSGLPDGDIEVTENEEYSEDDEVTVSGTERYDSNISWRKYAGSVAVLAVAVIGIASVVLLKGNLNSIDDFDTSSPTVIGDSYENEQSQVTEIVSGSYIDKGYHANGHDYANENDYQGVIVGGQTAVTEPQEQGHVVDVGDPPEININGNAHEDTPPPTTAPPATTAPPVVTTSLPVTTVSAVTTTVVAETSPAVQKTFLTGQYYIVSDKGEYDGFEFSPSGTVESFIFDVPFGNFRDYTGEVYGYEIIENQFSYGLFGDESSWKTGTILNGNDGTTFSVQFDDGVYTFSTDKTILENIAIKRTALSGTWYANGAGGFRRLDFYDDISGSMTYIESGTGVGFSYVINSDNNYIAFSIGSTDIVMTGTIIDYAENQTMVVSWDDGTVESFYSESVWTEMNQQ
ncbi:MAG: hypothetical protein NC177_06665 [Ruminococcus flavefaciens]|nr:hypothetical protein [Ruminococcus flavefaciens]